MTDEIGRPAAIQGLLPESGNGEIVAEYSGGAVSGHPDAVAAFLKEMARQEVAKQKRQKAFPGESGRERMTALCRLFPSVRESISGWRPWNAQKFAFAAVSRGACSGALHAVRFCLSVWNTHSDWPEILDSEAWLPEPASDDDWLWKSLQTLKAEARASLEEAAREDAKEHGRAPVPVLDQEVAGRLKQWFAAVGPFHCADAFSVWDDAHRAAFLQWCAHPFWP